MTDICFYFQVHQPYRLRKSFDFFSIGTNDPFEDDQANAEIMRKVAAKCYLPANAKILELIKKHQGRFKVSYSISGVCLDQFEQYAPEVLESFKALAETGCVEFIGETYYHSLSFLYSKKEFREQVRMHKRRIRELFGKTPTTFRNTELIYHNDLAQEVQKMGFKTIIAEGVERVLDWRSPNYVYQAAHSPEMKLLVKNYKLSDDIAFRFSCQDWQEYPLTADKFAHWVHQLAGAGETVNLFMDYETFGEHQWESSGIFEFLNSLPQAIFKHADFGFATPKEIVKKYPVRGELSYDQFVSWADTERDTSAWLGNPMQDSAIELIYSMEKEVLASKDQNLIHTWRKLQTSDHFYYMCVKYFSDGDVHKYFNPYQTPYDAFITYSNCASHIKWYLGELKKAKLSSQRQKRAMGRMKTLSKIEETPIEESAEIVPAL